MWQREEKCAWTLVRSSGTLPMGLGVLSRVPLRFWCKAGPGPGASAVRLTQRHPGAHWSLGLGSAHRALQGEGRWLQQRDLTELPWLSGELAGQARPAKGSAHLAGIWASAEGPFSLGGAASCRQQTLIC